MPRDYGTLATMPDAPKPQVDKFRDLARELECDDNEDAFAARVRKIATAPKSEKPTPKNP